MTASCFSPFIADHHLDDEQHMEQKIKLPYQDVLMVFEEEGYLPIFCTNTLEQVSPEMIHADREEFGPASIAHQESEEYDDDDWYADPDYEPPFDPNGVVFTFHLPKRAELCIFTIRETRDGGTLLTYKVSDNYDPAFSAYLDCVVARYYQLVADLRQLTYAVAGGADIQQLLATWRRQAATAAVTVKQPQQAADSTREDAAQQTGGEIEQLEQADRQGPRDTAEQESVRQRRRRDVEERDNLILAIYGEHPNWPYYRILEEARKRVPEQTFTDESVRNAFRRKGINRNKQRPDRTR
jgi:hypothetical protein